MKKILGILIAVAGLNAYADTLSFKNSTTEYFAVECFPSKTIFNGIHPAGGDCTCPADDTYMYFGRTSMPQDETKYLIPHTTFTAFFISETYTGEHDLGNGNVWKILKDTEFTTNYKQIAGVFGDPDYTVDVHFTN